MIPTDPQIVLKTLKALAAENPPGTLLRVSQLRQRVPWMCKGRFDKAAMELSRQFQICLHFHDAPMWLSKEVRDELIWDGEKYYCGIALRNGGGSK